VLATAVIYAYLFVVLTSLVPHEAGHAIFIKTKNKRLAKFFNEFFGRLICLPFALSFSFDWKRNHYEHHRDPIGSDDPQIPPERILYGKALYRKALALSFIPGYPGVSRFAPMRYTKKNKELAELGGLVFWVAAGWFLYKHHQAVTAAAIVVGLGLSTGYGFFKESIEHQRDVPSIFRTRTYLYPFHRIWMPVHTNYHFEHHLNSSVPWYNLPRFHEEIFPLIPDPIRAQLYDRSLADLIKTAAGRRREEMLAFSAQQGAIPSIRPKARILM
jgi:fatty acid desaturase